MVLGFQAGQQSREAGDAVEVGFVYVVEVGIAVGLDTLERDRLAEPVILVSEDGDGRHDGTPDGADTRRESGVDGIGL